MPTLIISDTHLGKPDAPRAAQLRPLWQGVRRLIVNGDVAEVQLPQYAELANRELAELRRLCVDDGVELVLLSGNHDADLTDRRHLFLHDEHILVTHGDAFHEGIAPWTRYAREMTRQTRAMLQEPRPADVPPLEHRLDVSRRVAATDFRKRVGRPVAAWHVAAHPVRVLKVLHYWQRSAKLATAFVDAHAPEARLVVWGHSHRAGHWAHAGRTIYNTGAFTFPGRPHAVRVINGVASLHRIRPCKQGRFHFDDRPRCEHPLPAPATPKLRLAG